MLNNGMQRGLLIESFERYMYDVAALHVSVFRLYKKSSESHLTELCGRNPPARITANRLSGADILQLEWSTFDISQIYRMPGSDIPTYRRLRYSIGTVLLDAMTS